MLVITAKDRKWLERSAYVGTSMYAGEYWEFAPVRFSKLAKLGLVRLVYPHNPVHKPRAVITDLGRTLLETSP